MKQKLSAYLVVCMWLAYGMSNAFAEDPPSNLNRELTTPSFEYHVYWTDDSSDVDYVSDQVASDVFDALDPTHQLYLDLGFRDPEWSSSDKNVWFEENVIDTAIATRGKLVYRPSRTSSLGEATLRLIALHEQFHHEQYAYYDSGDSADWGKWLIEATARLMQDKMYTDLDLQTTTTPSYTYYGEIASYLSSPNRRLMNISYTAVLFWNYLTEQFGGTAATAQQLSDPDLHKGVDFLVRFFNRMDGADPDTLELMDDLIRDIDPSRDFESTWQDFVVANYFKDFSVILPDVPFFPPLYGYTDDDDAGQNYPSILRSFVGTLSSTAASVVDNVTEWGARYFEGNISQNCSIYGVQATADDADAFMAVGLINSSNQAVSLYRTVGREVKQAYYLNRDDPMQKIALMFGGLDDQTDVEAVFVCGEGSISIRRPTFNNPEFVGDETDPDKFIIRLVVTGPPELGSPSVQGLNYEDFKVFVGAEEANVLYGLDVQGEYWLTVRAPVQAAGGRYDLTVQLGDSGPTDSQTLAVDYTEIKRSQILVIDESGSMASDNKMDAAKNASLLYTSVIPDDDQLAVVGFSADSNTLLPMVTSNLVSRILAGWAINSLAAGGSTSIGDGLDAAMTEFKNSGEEANLHFITLLSDGKENETLFWSDVSTELINSSTTVNTVGFGAGADQDTLSEIAYQTDGDFYYVDTGSPTASSAKRGGRERKGSTPQAITDPNALELPNRLANVFIAIEETTLENSRLWSEFGNVDTTGMTTGFTITEPDLKNGLLAINWSDSSVTVSATLTDPDGNVISDGVDGNTVETVANGITYRLPTLKEGSWTLTLSTNSGTVQYMAILSARDISGVEAQLVLQGKRSESGRDIGANRFLRGLPMPFHVVLTDDKGPILGAVVNAFVRLPDGSVDEFVLFDDGEHHDSQKDDGLYGIVFRRTIFASNADDVSPDETASPKSLGGSYTVSVMIDGISNAGVDFHRELLGAFHVYEYNENYFTAFHVDDDSDGIPDRWERLWKLDTSVDDTKEDPDRDGLTNREEYEGGTIPTDSDTDNGGEGDGSEVVRGANPSNHLDDTLPRPRDVKIIDQVSDDENQPSPVPNHILIHYPFSKFYKSVQIFRATHPSGPYSLLVEIPQADAKGFYEDTTVTVGTTYYYYVVGAGDSGVTSAPSSVVGAEAKADPVPPFGWVGVNHGAHLVDSLVASVQLSDSTDAVQMKIANTADFSTVPWQPFATHIPSHTIAPDPQNNLAVIFVLLRDASSNLSPIEHVTVKYDPDGDFDGDGVPNSTDPDDDGDGLTDTQEIQMTFTNPFNDDSDRDGTPDADEDTDGDGLSNAEEVSVGTDPLNSDTDGDGFSDADEIAQGTNPVDSGDYPGAPEPTPTITPTPSGGTGILFPFDFDIRKIFTHLFDRKIGIKKPVNILISRDQRFIYVGNEEDDTISTFQLDLKKGDILEKETRSGEALLRKPGNSVLSPDGKTLYVANPDSTIRVLDRDLDTGSLKRKDDVKIDLPPVGEESVRMAVSPNGSFLYMAMPMQERILIYKRDPLTGDLSFAKLFRLGGADTTRPPLIQDIAVSKDGELIYVMADELNGLFVLRRDRQSGNLVFLHQLDLSVLRPSGFEKPIQWDVIQVSPDDRHVALFSSATGRIALLKRGTLAGQIDLLKKGSQDDLLINGRSLAWHPDGKHFFVLSAKGVGIFGFDKNGDPTLVQKASADILGDDFKNLSALSLSDDGNFLFLVSQGDEQTSPALAVVQVIKQDVVEPTPTKPQIVPTPTRPQIVPTPTLPEIRPTPTKIIDDRPLPFRVYTFDNVDFDAEGIDVIPGGFEPGTPAGEARIGDIPTEPGSKATDGKGLILHCRPGEVQLVLARKLDIGRLPVIIRAAVHATSGEGKLALVAVDGSLDGSIATLIPSNTKHLVDGYKRMSILYEPITSESISVILQLAVPQTASEAVTVYVDNVQVIPLVEGVRIDRNFLKIGKIMD